MIEDEQKRFEEFAQKIKPNIDRYYNLSTKRKEIAQPPFPEKNGEYYYYSKPTHYKQNDYEIVFRKKGPNVKIGFFYDVERRIGS